MTAFESRFAAPPKGSKIEIFDTRTTLELNIPPCGFQNSDIFIIGFSTFWLCFVAFWIPMVLSAGAWFMALFSIPFWLVGIGMVSGVLSRIVERQVIEIDKYTLRILKSALFSKKVYDFDIMDIDSIGNQKANFSNLFKSAKFNTSAKTLSNKKRTLPTIRVGIKDVTIFEFLSETEQIWGIGILKQAIQRFAEKKFELCFLLFCRIKLIRLPLSIIYD